MVIPVLPDTERLTTYTLSAETGPKAVGFDIYGSGTDYANWIEVYDDGVKLTAVTDWTLDSPSGSLAVIARPITDARVTFLAARSGTIKIVGAERPRRTVQLTEGTGESAADKNRTYTKIMAILREVWDRGLRTLTVVPGDTVPTIPLLADRTPGHTLIWDGDGGIETGVEDGSGGGGGGGGSSNSFATISTPAGTNPVADSSTDTLTLTAGTGLSITGDSSNDSIAIAPAGDLAALAALASTGLLVRTASATYVFRTLTAPAAGITVTNGSGVGGNPTLVLADDLAALEALSGTNTLYYRSGASAWTAVTIGTGLSFSGGTLGPTNEHLAGDKTLDVGSAQTYTTLQAAADYALTIETQGYDVICQLHDASLSGATEISGPLKGGGRLYIRGDTATPGNRILTSSTNTDTLHVRDGAYVYLEGVKVTATGGTAANCIRTSFGGTITINDNCTFGATTGYHFVNGAGGVFFILDSYTIDGGAIGHWLLSTGTALSITGGITITLTGTPAFSGEFVQIRVGGSCRCWSVTFSGSATGTRFLIEPGGILDTNGTDPNSYFPGSLPGIIEYNGIYDGHEGPPRPSHRNLLRGSNFTTNPWQRGTTITGVLNSGYIADGFNFSNTSAGVVDGIKTADAPTLAQAGVYTAHCLHVDVTTADAAVAVGDLASVNQNIEGLDIAFLGFGQSGTRYVTLSFFVKSTKTGTHCVALQNSAASRSYVTQYTVNVADTWELKTITIAVDTTGTWLYDTGVGLRVRWALMCGTTRQTTPDSWQAGNFIATSSQVNLLDSVSNNFKIALPQLEAGSRASRFDCMTYDQVLAKARRYLVVADQYVPATTAQSLRALDMRDVPAITGGGAGFTSTGTTKDSLIAFQTAGAVATLTLTAEL
jgi:hypothetical protein